eukprot:PhM_4_TR13033/c0_g1_i1/m.29708
MSIDSGPCGNQSSAWRECMKEYGYTPDREKGACDATRALYYRCLKAYRDAEGISPEATPGLPEACVPASKSLHECMMVNTFLVDRCQKEMGVLRQCNEKHNPALQLQLQGQKK